MKQLFFLNLLAIFLVTGIQLPAQSLTGNSTLASAVTGNATVTMEKEKILAAAQQYAGAYISRAGDGYWQKLMLTHLSGNTFNVAITSGGAKNGCTFKADGVYANGQIAVDLSKVNPELQATMTITLAKDTARVFTSKFDERFKLMWFCGGGVSLAGNYTKEKTQVNGISWYKVFAGKIDRYPVTMHLHKAGHKYTGYYYYNIHQRPIYFFGEDSSTKGKLKLTGFSEPTENEALVLSLNGNQLTGNWRKKEAAKPLTFTAAVSIASNDLNYIFTQGVLPLRPKLSLQDAPSATFFAGAVWPAGESARDLFLKRTIRRFFGLKYSGTEEIGALFLNSKKSFFAAYLKDNQNVKDNEIKEMPISYTVDESKNIMVAFSTPKMLTLALSSYAYTGGAHGNYGTSYATLDLVNNKELLLPDVLNEQGIKTLSVLLDKSFRERYHLQPGESLVTAGLFDKTIKPNQNFYITPAGIAFNYMPYEIGPYALGGINLFIPIAAIENHLQPSVKILLQ